MYRNVERSHWLLSAAYIWGMACGAGQRGREYIRVQLFFSVSYWRPLFDYWSDEAILLRL